MVRKIVAVVVALGLAACAGGRGGVVDGVLDRSLYTAETKAERLLRYYEIQALLVRYAALFGGTKSQRNAIAAGNVVATGRLNEVFNCLHYGSRQANDPEQKDEATAAAIRGTNYCSFFDTRLLSYEAALLNLLRQATTYDESVSELKTMIDGLSAMDVWTLATNLITVAQRVARDARVIAAFKADTRELQFLVWHREIAGPEAVDAEHAYDGDIHPERDRPEIVERRLRAYDGEPRRPTVRVWHFMEVTAFLRDSCIELNDDAEMSDFNGMRCSDKLPFRNTSPAKAQEIVASTAVPSAAKRAASDATAGPTVVPASEPSR